MRILAVTNMYPSPQHPGRGVFIKEQVKGLNAVGIATSVLFLDRRQQGPSAYNGMGRRLLDAANAFSPHLIHVMYGGVMAAWALEYAHIRPTVVTFHGSDLAGENLSGWVRKAISRYGVWCSRRAAKAAEGVVVVAQHLLKLLPGSTRNKARVIPCGIDLQRFKPLDRHACQQKLGWDASAFHVLFASSNGDPVKRPGLAKAAVDYARARALPVELHFMNGVPNADVPLWLNASDCLLLTSLHEGSPTVVKEALACGLPVISVDVGDVAERIAGIPGCFLCKAEPADLAAKLSDSHALRRRLDCREQVADLSLTCIATRLKAFYEEVLDSQPSSAPLPAIAA